MLYRHIPNRIGAAMTSWQGEQRALSPFYPRALVEFSGEDFARWCAPRAVEHGRLIAMRWLIEFCGVAADKHPSACPTCAEVYFKPKQHGSNTPPDIGITQLGGQSMSVSHNLPKTDPAYGLAQLWAAASKSASHATYDSNHGDTSLDTIHAALETVMDHLDREIYKRNWSGKHCKHLTVRDVVQHQEAFNCDFQKPGANSNFWEDYLGCKLLKFRQAQFKLK